VDDNSGLSAAELLAFNRDLQGSRAIRLLAATNLSLYATLMERHLNDGALPETELVVRLERDLDDLDDPQSGPALTKSWAAQGWLHRIVEERHDHDVCCLTQDARRALDVLRGMRRQDTIATGGSITGITSRLKQVAVKVDNDPARIRKHIEAEIAALTQNRATRRRPAALTRRHRLLRRSPRHRPTDGTPHHRHRPVLHHDRAGHRCRRRSPCPPSTPLRKIMAGFFELVGHQIDEVERI
jgi:hypothetical protein